MLETILQDAAVFLGALHLLSPIVARSTMRFAAHCNPVEIPLEDLPSEVVAIFRSRIAELGNLGFDLLGCYDCGSLTSETRSLAAYFCNRTTNELANVSVMITPKTVASYFEFSARFANGLILETNSNGTIPLTPENPELRTFRFPKIQAPQALYRVHRQLGEKYAPGLWPLAERKGQELHRFFRVLENYGPRHRQIGYMALANDGQTYRLTWKGACLMTWRGLWPTSLLRNALERHAMQSELDSLEVRGLTALQKA
jgi:hypothetical protein